MAEILDFNQVRDEASYIIVCAEIDKFLQTVSGFDAGFADYLRRHIIRDPVKHTLMWASKIPGEVPNPTYEDLIRQIFKKPRSR